MEDFMYEVGQNVKVYRKNQLQWRGKIIRAIFDKDNCRMPEYLVSKPFCEPQWAFEDELQLF